MNVYSRILVAIDESPASDHAVRAAARLAREHDGILMLCHAVNWVPLVSQMASTGAMIDVDSVVSDLNATARALLVRRAQTAERTGIGAQCFPIEGEPAAAILELAEREDCSLIVTGTRGISTVARFFIGSTTEAILRKSAVPVLTVRPDEKFAPETRALFERVIVGVDGSEPSVAALNLAFDLPPGDRRELFLYAVAGDSAAAYERAENSMVKAVAAAEDRHVKAKGIVVAGRPEAMLVAAAQQRCADLIVVGTHGRQGVSRLMLGSVAEHIIRHATTPVLVVNTAARAAHAARAPVAAAV